MKKTFYVPEISVSEIEDEVLIVTSLGPGEGCMDDVCDDDDPAVKEDEMIWFSLTDE